MSQYNPIAPIPLPTLGGDVLLGRSSTPLVIAMVSVESNAMSVATLEPRGIVPKVTMVHYCLAPEPIRLRVAADAPTKLDIELYLDLYSYGGDGAGPIDPQQYPPRDPFALPPDPEFFRSRNLYCFQDVPIPAVSPKVWDGRSAVAVNPQGVSVNPASKIDSVRAEAREAIVSLKTPTFITSLRGFGKTRTLPALTVYQDVFSRTLEAFLEQQYNASGIPPQPLRLTEAPQSSGISGASEGARSIAAELDGPYFVRWVQAPQTLGEF
jgi:hypothetical protein